MPPIRWTTIRLVVSENEWRRHESEMEPQGRGKFLSASCAETNHDSGPEEDHSQIESACSSSWAECRDKKESALSRRGGFSLDIPFYRTCPVCAFIRTYCRKLGPESKSNESARSPEGLLLPLSAWRDAWFLEFPDFLTFHHSPFVVVAAHIFINAFLILVNRQSTARI